MKANVRITGMKGGKLWHYGHFCHDWLFPVITHYQRHLADGGVRWTAVRTNCINPNQRLGTFRSHAEHLLQCPVSEIVHQAEWLECRKVGPTLDLPAWNMVGWQAGQCDALHAYAKERFGPWLRCLDQEYPEPVLLIERGVETLLDGLQDTGANRRSIDRHADLVDYLETAMPGKVRTVRLEGMPVLHQIACFRRRRMIVGQHGAGLCNAAWNIRRAPILEVRPNKSPTFMNLARAIGSPWVLVDNNIEEIGRAITREYGRLD